MRYTIFVLYCSKKSHTVRWPWPWLPVTLSPFISSWPGLHSCLYLDHYEIGSSAHICNVVFAVTRSAFNSSLRCLRFTFHCIVFASPDAPDCLHCWTTVTIIASRLSPRRSLHNSALHAIQVKYINVLCLVWYGFTGPKFSCLNSCGVCSMVTACVVHVDWTKVLGRSLY